MLLEMDSPWPIFSLLLFFWCQGRGLSICLPEPRGLGPRRANDSTILADPMTFFLFFLPTRSQNFFDRNSTNFKPSYSYSFEIPKKVLFPDGYIVNSILAFTISWLLFFSAGTTFAFDTFACDMTSSTPFTSMSATSVSTTSFSSHSSCTVGVWVFPGMVETASSWTFHSQQLLTVLAEIKPQSWLKKKKKNVGFWCWQLPVWIEIK